jgi:C2H2-type zinc finger
MKLARVNLARAITIGRKHGADIVAENGLELEADMGSRVIWIGDQFVPFEAVNLATKAEADVPCPECQKKFTNLQALGAHRNKAHGVRGGGEAA